MNTVVVPAILVIMMLLGINVSNYSGMTIGEAFQDAKYTGNYNSGITNFDATADQYINNPNFNNVYITSSDIQQAQNVTNPYDYLVQSGSALYDAINGQYDTTWMPTADAREIRVYDADGNLIGATIIIGVTQNQYMYRDQVVVRPNLYNNTSAYFQQGYLLFMSTSAAGTFYHTDLPFIYNTSSGTASGIAINNFGYKYWLNNTADNVSFVDMGYGNFPLKLVYQGEDYITSYYYMSPIEGRNDTSTETDYIGTAILQDGTTVGINPDGSITLPDGSTIYPNSDGTFPYPVTGVDFPPTFWDNVADDVAQGAGTTSGVSAETDEILDGIRDNTAELSRYMKKGFWENLRDFFTPNYETITTNLDEFEPNNLFGYVRTAYNKSLEIFGISSTRSAKKVGENYDK